ncbi:hypothetical protein QTO34_001337 [Cnephaeus nilssonii]|uniref:Uncharacterized protein n=1 Tax=Cnephaeus nilssonii TaxID=3371016 RepID=A0AA40HVI0_CNENI|nr:hypothetical protein QTO34_001337 [Eptesicus nilssonii]
MEDLRFKTVINHNIRKQRQGQQQEKAPAPLTLTASIQRLPQLLGTISRCEQRLPAPIGPEGIPNSPCS